MLETMRRQGASIFIYLIFCLLIAIFVINFGPQGGNGGKGGCSGASNQVVSVNGEDATQTAYKIAFQANQAAGKQKTWVALELLIRRAILAQEAESRGLLSTDDAVQLEIEKGWFFMGGQRMKIPGIFDENGLWNKNAFKNWVGQLYVSKNAYLGEQQRSMLAGMMATVIEDSVGVSREEALNDFLFQGNTAMYDVVAFKPEVYRSALKITDADVDRFIASHGPEIEARFKADERTYKGVKPQLFLREIFIAKPVAAGSGSAAAPDDGKAKLDAARAAIGNSKDKFAAQAKQLNSDEASRNAAGELGWRSLDNPMLGDKALTDAVKTLKPGEMTPVITTDRGAFLIMAEDKREGDLSFDQVKREIAKDLARDTWGKEAAKRAAITALAAAQNGPVHTLDALYDKDKSEGPGPNIDLEKIINNPNLTDEQKQQLLQQLIQQQQGPGGAVPPPDEGGDGPHGALEVASKDVPAGWSADANGAGGSGSAAVAPAAGSGAGAAVAAGSGAGSAAAPAAPAAATTAEINTPSEDQLPAMADIPKPHDTRYGPAPRTAQMPGRGQNKDAIAAVFDELEPGALATKVYEGENGDYILVQEIQRQKPNVADFDKDADDRVAALREQRSRAFLNEWLKERCEKLVKDNKIIVNNALLVERDDQGKALPIQYRPCISFR